MTKVSDNQKGLFSYGKQRQRLIQGAKGAIGAGTLASLAGKKKLVLPAAALGAAAGVADKIYEEKAQMPKTASVNNRDFPFTDGAEQGHVRSTQGILETLFSQKGRKMALADEQLKSLFPEADKESYGNTLRAGLSAREASKRVTRALKG